MLCLCPAVSLNCFLEYWWSAPGWSPSFKQQLFDSDSYSYSYLLPRLLHLQKLLQWTLVFTLSCEFCKCCECFGCEFECSSTSSSSFVCCFVVIDCVVVVAIVAVVADAVPLKIHFVTCNWKMTQESFECNNAVRIEKVNGNRNGHSLERAGKHSRAIH